MCDGELDGGGRHALHGVLLEQKADLGIVLTLSTPAQTLHVKLQTCEGDVIFSDADRLQ